MEIIHTPIRGYSAKAPSADEFATGRNRAKKTATAGKTNQRVKTTIPLKRMTREFNAIAATGIHQ